jgi:hypothetical protein
MLEAEVSSTPTVLVHSFCAVPHGDFIVIIQKPGGLERARDNPVRGNPKHDRDNPFNDINPSPALH